MKMADYANAKAAYEKEKAAYDNAHFVIRKLMSEPVDPGVPPVRESNTILKPVEIAELDAQIKAKDAELVAVNNKRRDRVAQVDADARRLREEFDRRSSTKREATDRKRDELAAAQAALAAEWKADEKQIDQELAAAVQKVDGIREELDASRKKAEGFYEAREAAIRNTQVHRIATTVEIVRGLLMGERPMSIKATAKERGDILTDQISMVRIWVYPVLAFIVAFLPTLMVEIGFSTVFLPAQQRPPHRLGFLGRRMHWLYTRAGRLKVLRAERLAREAFSAIASRDAALAAANTAAAKTLAAKDAELQAARDANDAAAAGHHAVLQKKEGEWVAKFTELADSLNRAVVEKDALRDLQKSEIERQVQMRQNAWSDRLTQLRQELDDQRAASEAERTTLLQAHHQKLMAVTEDCKTQVIQARREMADAELAAMEKSAKLAHDLKEALHARDAAEAQLKHQADSLSVRLAQAKEDTAREMEKAARQEKLHLEQQRVEFEKALRQQEEALEHRSKQREQELSVALEARVLDEKTRVEQAAHRREGELERQFEARVREMNVRWNQELQQRDEAALLRLQQREQQLQAQAGQEMQRRELELKRQLDAHAREADMRWRQELQQKELAFHAQLKQCEQALASKAAARETEMQNQWAAELRSREQEWERQTEARVRAIETRWSHEAQQKEEIFQTKIRQRELQLQSQFDARKAELQAQREQDLRDHEQEWERNAEASARATESRWMAELQQKEELFQSKLRQRDEHWQIKLDTVRTELQAQTEQDLRRQEMESADARLRAQRELEVAARKEMQEKLAAVQTETKQREQTLVAQLAAKTEAHQSAEQERDEARKIAFEVAREVQELKNKLTEASSLLTGWNNDNGKNLANQFIIK
jgi:hypothetical protein